jgi:hypothetical protein
MGASRRDKTGFCNPAFSEKIRIEKMYPILKPL